MAKKIEISTLNISVRILMLDNKRFTKAVYKQLPVHGSVICYCDCDDKEERKEVNGPHQYCLKTGYIKEKESFKILGYVKDDEISDKFMYGEKFSLLINNDGTLERIKFPCMCKNFDVDDNHYQNNVLIARWRNFYLSTFSQIFISC